MKKLLATILFVLFGFQVSAQDFEKGFEAAKNKDYSTAYKEWMPLALLGNAKAQGNIGYIYSRGYGVPINFTEAIEKATAMARECMASDYKKCGY